LKDYIFEDMLKRLKARKKEVNLTNKQLAVLSDVPLGTVNRVLAGQTKEPQFNTMLKLAEALGASADYIIYGESPDTEKATPDLIRDDLTNLFEKYNIDANNPKKLRLAIKIIKTVMEEDI